MSWLYFKKKKKKQKQIRSPDMKIDGGVSNDRKFIIFIEQIQREWIYWSLTFYTKFILS